MKEIPKVVQKFSREQESAVAAAGAAGAVVYEPVEKHKVTPVYRGGLKTLPCKLRAGLIKYFRSTTTW